MNWKRNKLKDHIQHLHYSKPRVLKSHKKRKNWQTIYGDELRRPCIFWPCWWEWRREQLLYRSLPIMLSSNHLRYYQYLPCKNQQPKVINIARGHQNFTFFWLKKRHSSTQKCTGQISKHDIGDNMKQLTSTRLALKVPLFKLKFFWFKVSWLSSRYNSQFPNVAMIADQHQHPILRIY